MKTTQPPQPRPPLKKWREYIRKEVERMTYGKPVKAAKPVLKAHVQKMYTVGLTKDGKTFILG
jgi:hypothetical protein